MRLLIVGAGASYAEAQGAGLPEQLRPPLMKDFAKRFWADYNPHDLLQAYLKAQGHKPGQDPRELFFDLESRNQAEINVEGFFQFAWINQNKFPGAWENLLYHGILNPLVFLLSQGVWAKPPILKCPMPAAQSVARYLQPGDAVINLNYDTIFEIGATQVGHHLVFLPNRWDPSSQVAICKPHGSLNLVVNEQKGSFRFGQLDWPGTPQPSNGSKNYIGFVPPRMNKSYPEHPVAMAILKPIRRVTPHVVTFWGVGLTASDADLLELYVTLCGSAESTEMINPSDEAVERAERFLGRSISHFRTIHDWKKLKNGTSASN